MRAISEAVVILAPILILLLDLPALLTNSRGDTQTEVVIDWSTTWWIIPIAFGELMGHFFFTQRVDGGWSRRFITLILINIILSVANLWTASEGMTFSKRWMFFLTGIPIGSIFWPIGRLQ